MNSLLVLAGLDAKSILYSLNIYSGHDKDGNLQEDAMEYRRISPSLCRHPLLLANVDEMARLVDNLVDIDAWDSFFNKASERYCHLRRGAQMQPFDIDHQESQGTEGRTAIPGWTAAFSNLICCQPLPLTGSQDRLEQGREDSSRDESSENSATQDESTLRTTSTEDVGCPDEAFDAMKEITFTDN